MQPDDSHSANQEQRPYISKSKYLSGLQCSKLLWHQYNRKDLIPEPDAATQAIFDQGHEVGELAKQLFPDGIEVADGTKDFSEVLEQSREALHQHRPLFEAGFTYNGGYARVDILDPVSDGQWDIFEVKSSTEAKDVNVYDLAFQTYVYPGAGINIRRTMLMHIDRSFVRRGPVDPRRFFTQRDLTPKVSQLSHQIESQLDDMFLTIREQAHPDIRIGPRCSDPYVCPLTDHCWSFLPENSVMDLYYGGRKCWRLLDEGILAIRDIPEDTNLTDRQEIQRKTILSGKPHIDRPALKSFLTRLQYPVSYLDFETFATAIPLFDGLRPYQNVPFQFSLHVQDQPGGPLQHHGFLADGSADPRPEFIRELRQSLPAKGSVVVYNASFEAGVLERLAAVFPEHDAWVGSVRNRMVDLLDPFKAFDFYHPGQHGSASIKAVLPAVTGRSYSDLAIQEGGAASREFVRVHFENVPEADRQQVRRQLKQYCALDTEAMVWIVEELKQLAKPHED